MKTINQNSKKLRQKKIVDDGLKLLLLIITLLCALITVGIILFIGIKGLRPFFHSYDLQGQSHKVNMYDFLTGNYWFLPPSDYGVGFIIVNTLYIVFLATIIAVPISVLTALFITRMASKKVANFLQTIVELLASIPSIIYGVFGVGVIALLVRNVASFLGYQSAGGISTISTVLVLVIMILPTITMLSMTSIRAVKQELILGSLALGASPTQTNFKVVLTAAKSGIFSGITLGIGRALGEATAISMVIGNRGSGPIFHLFETSRTLTSTMLLGLKETTGLDYDIRFSVGLVLILTILVTNICLNWVKKKIGGIHE